MEDKRPWILELMVGRENSGATPTDFEMSQLTELARCFKCLQDAPGTKPFEPQKLADWAAGPISELQQIAAGFLLALYSTKWTSELHRFGLAEVERILLLEEREALLQWYQDPFMLEWRSVDDEILEDDYDER